MSIFDLEAGKRFRHEGEIVDALRCFRSALEQDRDSFETYVELAFTYLMAFDDSGDPLCLDSARNVCVAGLRREPPKKQHDQLFELQEKIETLLLDSQKAEMDAMTDAIAEPVAGPELVADPSLDPDLTEKLGQVIGKAPDDEISH
jgi:hypothetical protein